MERSRQGSLDMLRDALRVYGARYLLPFASFFTLWHPDHRRYLELFRKNAPADVAAALDDLDVEVLDLLPGEIWNALNGKRTRVTMNHRSGFHASPTWSAAAASRPAPRMRRSDE